MAEGETNIKTDPNSPVEQKKTDGIFKTLFKRITGAKFVSPEINIDKLEKIELQSETGTAGGDDWLQKMYDLTGNMVTDARQLESDRFVRYKDYEQMCLSGETEIPLINGTSIKIKDWAVHHKSESFYVYSYDIENKKITAGQGFNPRVTRTNSKTLKITFNNGMSEICTPDHLFLLESNEYVEASKLNRGDKIKTLNRRISIKSRDSLEGYEMIHEDGKWEFTHRKIAADFYRESQAGDNIHHGDHNKRNNNPSNLNVIKNGKHYNLHIQEKINNNEILPLFDDSKFKKKIVLPDNNLNPYPELEVVTIEDNGEEKELYDISVQGFNNFALSSGIFVHNCFDSMIGGMVETYADEIVQQDEKGNVVVVKAKDKKTERLVKELFIEKLKLNENLWRIAFEMVKYGDTFYEIIFNKKLDDMLYLKFISPYKIWRVEKEGKLKGFKYIPMEMNVGIEKESEILKQLKSSFEQNLIEPFKIVDFRIEDAKYAPFGRSILDSSRTSWKQLKLLEDAAIIYRLARAPTRRVWNVDVGQLSHDKAIEYVKRVRDSLNKKSIIDPTTGKIVDAKKALSMVEDFWIPARGGTASTSVTNLDGQQRLGEVDDLQWFRDKIMFYMRIPKSWLAPETQTSGKTLAAVDVNFAKAIEKIQTFIEAGLYKIAYIYLILKGIPPDRIKSLKLQLTPPSMYKELMKYEFLKMKFEFVGSVANTNMFPTVYILKEYMNLSDEEVIAITGLMQAQTAGGDMLSILTGQPSPFASAMPGQPAAETPQNNVEQQMMAGMGGLPPAGQTPEANPAVQPTNNQPVPATQETEKVLSPTELAVKALMNLESIKASKNSKLLLESREKVLKLYEAKAVEISTMEKKLLRMLKEKNIEEEFHGGFQNLVTTGELKGLRERVQEKKQLLTEHENPELKTKEHFEDKLKRRETPVVSENGEPSRKELMDDFEAGKEE